MASQQPSPRIRRPDVEGMRAVASLLVAIYHVWPGRVSGGVDVFFVVAGFLLVPPLVAAIADRGPRAAASTVRRAIVRQLPLAGLVLGVVTLAVLTLWPPHLRRGVLLDVLSAATWTINWRLVDRSTDYLAQTATASPVQHLWATSVQLQATIALVLVVLAAALVGARAGARRRVLAAVGCVGLASFAWAQVHVALEPDAAYFDTAARLWEPAVGALAGLLAPSLRLASVARTALAGAGIALVLGAGALSTLGAYPGAIALVPVAGAVAVLVAGAAGAPTVVARALGWRPLVVLGGLSWGLYLWSWPLLVAYRLMAPDRASATPLVDGLLLVAGGVALAWLSQHVLHGLDLLARWRPSRLLAPVAAAATLVAVVTVGAASPASAHVARIDSPAAAQAAIDATLAGASFAGTEAIGSASQAPEWVVDDCLDAGPDRADRCVYGPADATLDVAVVGDSQAISWMPALRLGLPDARIQVLTMGSCAFSTVTTDVPDIARDACAAHGDWATERLLADPPDLVVVANGLRSERLVDADGVVPAGAGPIAAAAGTAERLAPLADAGARILWLDAPPPFASLAACATPHALESATARCTVDGTALDARVDALAAASATLPGTTFVDARDWLCADDSAVCPATIDGMLVTADGSHLSWMASQALAPLVGAAARDALA
ncbi:acyltransferase family protein [Agrococcus jejuensis]|uniref:Peptidoglycan/LPS O-acetylase OafA/YrhL, contains acyltransferase and SGNH-hydrolase domains n=1 Tax=Agrococcus jejuensis TaxID=399736 RepID=A0A1G8FVK5_9MICO|nr:acyltransferase family protein [Agrococcus jejuensis]SDH86184.1 Peptidoglycan/LPS O-acetylase OafA/YrhL, contains acyltransferase and SGNH-hydrolase domains [Agrococcus jejuensis]